MAALVRFMFVWLMVCWLCVLAPPPDIKEHVKQIEKAVSGKEPRFVLRALRALPSTSRRLNSNVLHKAVNGFFTSNSSTRDFLLGFLEEVGRQRALSAFLTLMILNVNSLVRKLVVSDYNRNHLSD